MIVSTKKVSVVMRNLDTDEYYLEVPVRAHVKAFMLRVFAKDNNNFWKAETNTTIGSLVWAFCKNPDKYCVRSRKRISTNRASMKVVLPNSLRKVHLTEDDVAGIGKMFENYFTDLFHFFVLGGAKTGLSEMASTNCFFTMFDINPNDWDNDAGYSSWKRFNNRVVSKN